MMRLSGLLALFVLLLQINSFSQEIPGQYIMQWEDPLQTGESLKRYTSTGEVETEVIRFESGRYALSLKSADSLSGIMPNRFFVGDFVLTMDLHLAHGPSDSSGYFAFHFARRDSLNYYRIIVRPVEGAYNIALEAMQRGEHSVLEQIEVDRSFLPPDGWFHFGLRHNILEGSILLWLHKTKSPIMKVMSRKLVLGAFMYESYHLTSGVDNINVYAPTRLDELIE
ncbi:MAG: hypothetical protein ACOC10_00150 [Bacteroidota bacterium]